jgi:hypothetical protein
MTRITHFSNLLDRIDIDWDTQCWNWRGHKTIDGYGRTSFYGKLRLAHRLSKFLFGHMRPKHFNDIHKVVMHKCDNPACINPHHLVVGTQLENIADRHAKGRTRGGTSVWSARLTEDNVRSIRCEYKNSQRSAEELALKHKVSVAQIKAIAYRQKWKHVK